MKLAKLILPLLDNAGRDLIEEHRELQHVLRTEYGGFTSTEGVGGWRNKHGKLFNERVVIYEVAMEMAAVTHFRDIAQHVASEARQEAVMIVTPCGDVEFIHPPLTQVAAQA